MRAHEARPSHALEARPSLALEAILFLKLYTG